ncbi:PsbP-related protein [Patescibacteria group bacterium]
MNKKVLGIGIALVIVIIAGFLIWKNQDGEKVAQVDKADNQVENRDVFEDISDWQTYENEKYRFSVKYPKSWSYKVYKPDNVTGDAFGEYGVYFGEKGCIEKSESVTGDCDNYTFVSIYDDLDEFNKLYERRSDDPKVTGVCKKDIDLLDFSEAFPEIRACRKDFFGYVWDNYYFVYDNLGYKLTIRHIDPNYDPKNERTILQSFKLIEK